MEQPFFSEIDETHICEDCKKEFKAYNYWEDCPNCNDGEDDEGETCFVCGGRGDLESIARNTCQDCLYIYLTKNS